VVFSGSMAVLAAVEKIIGRQGNVSGGVLYFNAPRAESSPRKGWTHHPLWGRHRHKFPAHRKWTCGDSWGISQ
jgi:hypothetical protein